MPSTHGAVGALVTGLLMLVGMIELGAVLFSAPKIPTSALPN